MSAVTLSSVTKKFGSFTAVDSINLEVEAGEFVTLLGPSGCGKTTTLRMVAGFVRPTSGNLTIGGKDVTAVPPHLRNVGLVFQNYALFPHMNVKKNVEFGLKMQKVAAPERNSRVAEILDIVRLGHLDERTPAELSGGQQQRVALARALVIRPEVLLLDEPFGALDKQLRDHMRVELRELQKKLNISTLFVTHDQDEALSMSDRIVVMSEGKVVQVGGPTDIYERPRTEFVADFMGRSNILDGKVEIARGKNRIINVEGMKFSLDETQLAEGSRQSVMLRPERIHIEKINGKVSTKTLSGQVLSKEYLGSAIQYNIQVKNGPVLLVSKNNIGSQTSGNISQNDWVSIDVPENAVYLLPR